MSFSVCHTDGGDWIREIDGKCDAVVGYAVEDVVRDGYVEVLIVEVEWKGDVVN